LPKIALTTRDGERLDFRADASDNLLDAAAQAHVILPAFCRKGHCGLCNVRLANGQVRSEPCEAEALSERDRADGEILLCRAHAASDLSLQARYDHAAIAFDALPQRQAVVREVEPVGKNSVYLKLALEDHPQFGLAADFLPGQFAEIVVPGREARRAYSPTNISNFDGMLEFLIGLQPGGVFSGYLGAARCGDRLTLIGPHGGFTLDEASTAPRWFVAGGTGLAPILSLLTDMAERGDRRPCHLFFRANAETEMSVRERITALRILLPQLAVTICVTQTVRRWPDYGDVFAGTLNDALMASYGPRPDLYISGPPSFVSAVKTVASKAGLAPDRMFCEMFSSAV